MPISSSQSYIDTSPLNVITSLTDMSERKELTQEERSSLKERNEQRQFLDNIAKIKFSNWRRNITFITKDNKKYSYSIRAKEDYVKLKEVFINYS